MTPLHLLAKKWAKAVVDLQQLEVPPFLERKKKKLIKQAIFIKSALEKSDHVTPVATELGFIPLLVAGGIAAAAAMTKWITDAKQVTETAQQSKTDAEAVKQLMDTGLTQQQAVDVVLGKKTTDWKKYLIPAGIGFTVLMGLMWFMRGKRNG
jgi:hypothetical protein